MKKLGLVLSLAIFGLVVFVATSWAECPSGAMSSATATAEQVLGKKITASSVSTQFSQLAEQCPDNKVVHYLYGAVLLNLHDEQKDPQQRYAIVKKAFAAFRKGDGWYNQQVLVNGQMRTLKYESKFRKTALKALFNYTAAGYPPPPYLTVDFPTPECPSGKIVDAGAASNWVRFNKTSTDPETSAAFILLKRIANACRNETHWLNRAPLAYLAKSEVFLGERALAAGDRDKAREYAQSAKANVAIYIGDSKYHSSWLGSDQTALDKLLTDSAKSLSKAEQKDQFARWCDPANKDTAGIKTEMRTAVHQAWSVKDQPDKKRMDGLMAVKDVISGMYGACANTGRKDENAARLYSVISDYNRSLEAKADYGYKRGPVSDDDKKAPETIPSYMYAWLKPKPDTK